MIKCPACGFDNKSDAKFCLNCGSDLSKAAPPPEAYDPVGEEATVLIDPAQMQKRIAEEIKRERAVEAVGRLMEAPPPAPARSPVPQSPPPIAAATPAPVAPAAPAPVAAKGGSTAMLVVLIGIVLFLLLVVAGLLVVLFLMRG